MVMFGRTVRIAVWSRNGLWKRGVGAATFTARGIGIVPLGERAREENRERSKVRATVEHVFAHQEAMGGKRVRTVGLARARIKIGMMNLVYNLRRLAWLQVQRRPVCRYVMG